MTLAKAHMSQKIADLDFRRLTCPIEKIGVRPKRVKLAPENQTDGLKQVIGIFPVSDDRKDVAVELALVASYQLREYVLVALFAHWLTQSSR